MCVCVCVCVCVTRGINNISDTNSKDGNNFQMKLFWSVIEVFDNDNDNDNENVFIAK